MVGPLQQALAEHVERGAEDNTQPSGARFLGYGQEVSALPGWSAASSKGIAMYQELM